MSAYRLRLGDLWLDDSGSGGDDSFWFVPLVDGFSLGSPQAITVIQESLMRDGEDERWDRDSNREITFTVVARGPDLAALSDAERALRLVTYRRNDLAWTPPDGYGVTTVFDVMTSSFQLVTISPTWDIAEARSGVKERAYAVTLRCLPHGRSAELVTQVLSPTAATPTTLDNVTTTTAWSTPVSGQSRSATTLGGAPVLYVEQTSGTFGTPLDLRWSGAGLSEDYIGIEVRPNVIGFDLGDLDVRLSGALPDSTEIVTHGANNFLRCWFPSPGSTPLLLTLDVTGNEASFNSVYVSGLVESTAQGPGAILAVETIGSVRSIGSVTCERASDDIEWLFLYADPYLGAFSPRLPGSWANGREGTYVVYAENTFAEGDIVSAAFTDTAGRVATTRSTRIDAEVAALSWQPLGLLNLGGFATGLIGAQTVVVTVGGSPVTTPALRLFRIGDDTTLHYLDGVSGAEVVVAAPSADHSNGGVWVDGVAVESRSPGFPVIEVPATALYAEANDSNTSPATTTLRYPPTFHTYSSHGEPEA